MIDLDKIPASAVGAERARIVFDGLRFHLPWSGEYWLAYPKKYWVLKETRRYLDRREISVAYPVQEFCHSNFSVKVHFPYPPPDRRTEIDLWR
jgi:hypothetical protein